MGIYDHALLYPRGGCLDLVYRTINSNHSSPKDNTSPLDIAKSRYAKGDITKAQFHELKKDLKD